jgi:putative peptidoglycan lipid II flippase
MLRWLKRESKSIIGAATIVGVLSFVSRFVGFIRDRIMAGEFGAGDTLDVYYAAFKIPDLMFSLIVVGALSASFIPLFLSHYNKPLGKEKAWLFTNNALHIILIAVGAISLLLIIFAEPLSQLIAPGFQDYKQVRVAEYMRVMFLAQVILSVSMIFGSALQSLKRFFMYALAPIFYNAGIIFGVIFLVDWMGPIGLAWGVVLGAMLHLCSQVFGMIGTGYKYKFVIAPRKKDIKEMMLLMGPRTLGLAVNQLMFVTLTIIASTMVVGSVTIFQFAYNIQFFPVGIIGVSFAIAVFPSLSELGEKKQFDKFRNVVASSSMQLLYLMLPMSLLFLIFRAQIVRVVVGAGAFDWAATIATADTLAFFALTFIPQAFVFLLARSFYAIRDTVTPLTIAVVSAFVGILVAFLLRESFGVTSLSIAYSMAVIVNATLLWISLRQRLGTLHEAQNTMTVLKLLTCTLGAGVVMQVLKPFVVSVINIDTFIGVFSQGLIAGGIGLIVYVLLAQALQVEEQQQFIRTLKRSVLKKIRTEEVVAS